MFMIYIIQNYILNMDTIFFMYEKHANNINIKNYKKHKNRTIDMYNISK